MLLVTNFQSFPAKWTARTGATGASIFAETASAFCLHRRVSDAVFVVNCNPGLVMDLAARMLVGPRRPLIAVDLVLRAPDCLSERLRLPLKRALFRRVDHFIHYFRDLRGLERVFGISPARSSFVPFKVNLISRHALQPRFDGEYVLCFGRSMRDFDTFLSAMEQLPYPGAITRPDPVALRSHHGRFTRPLDRIPPNVALLDDDGTEQSEVRILRNAKLLALPILQESMVASGISTSLNAMFLGKCVIGSEGPGMSDVFGPELLTFPPEDPNALAAVIRRAWEDDTLRNRTAEAGHRYALAVGAEPELYQRIIDQIALWHKAEGTRSN
jgi:glycosyltransferase involved in cell wall biosynthesis